MKTCFRFLFSANETKQPFLNTDIKGWVWIIFEATMNQADIESRVSKEDKDSRSQWRLDSRHLESRLMSSGIES